jgi:putative glycosyltransferase
MKLSVVATLYHSAAYLQEFHRRVSEVARAFAGESYEIVLVNDGSPDDSLQRAVDLAAGDPHVVVVDLSRNFGHHKAMMTGLSASCGDEVFLIDSDLEEEPEWLPLFQRQLKEDDADVVYGVQAQRRGGWLERVSGRLFYRLFRLLTGIDQPNDIVTARLMTRRYVDALLRHEERELNIGGLWVVTGFRQTRQVVRKLATSPTTYTLSRKFGHLVNAVTSFSSLPLVFTFYSGLVISTTAAMYILALLLRYFFVATPPDGYTSIVASIWLFSGLIILFLGVQGIYISKIFSEVKQRPYTIVRQVYRGTDRGSAA